MGQIMVLCDRPRVLGTRKTSVFLVGQIPKDFIEVRCQKTQQKINASLPRVQRALLTHCRQRSPRVRRVGSLSRRYHTVCAHYLPMCASQSGYYLAI